MKRIIVIACVALASCAPMEAPQPIPASIEANTTDHDPDKSTMEPEGSVVNGFDVDKSTMDF